MSKGLDTEKQLKHGEIIDSIGRLSKARDELQNLLDKVAGLPAPEAKDKAEEVSSIPTLMDFLNQTSGQIDKITDDLNRIREEIRSAIF